MKQYISKLSNEGLDTEIMDYLQEDCRLKWRHVMLFYLLQEKLNRIESEEKFSTQENTYNTGLRA